MLSTITVVLAICYLFLALRCRAGFLRIHGVGSETPEGITTPHATVIVAARNEADSISACLNAFARLEYPDNKLRFIVVDDGSTDSTADVVRAHSLYGRSLRLLNTEPERTGKREAIRLALEQAETEVVLTTDADCIVPSTWARSMTATLGDDTAFVAGPVLYTYEQAINHRIQALEFLGLVAVGAGSIGAGLPTICNSANLCYRRSVFLQMSTRHPDVARLPGFDEALLQSIHRDSDWRVAFCPGKDAAVRTTPAPDTLTFLRQRIRWASMAGRLPDWRVKLISIVIFLFFSAVVALAASVLALGSSLYFLAVALAIKLIADFSILSPATTVYDRRALLPVFLPAELLHIPYILMTSLLGLSGLVRSKKSDVHRW